jgi:hypothetical protein
MKRYSIIVILGLLSIDQKAQSTAPLLSNFLDRRYNQITQIKAHNATSTRQKSLFWFIPNLVADQNNGIEQQLADGIRAFKIPVHPVAQNNIIIPWITHTLQDREIDQYVAQGISYIPSFLQSLFAGRFESYVDATLENNLWEIDLTNMPLEAMLVVLKNFLDTHPQEIITLFLNIFDLNQMVQQLPAVFQTTGINTYMFTQPIDQEWPTIRQLITNNQRLIVFGDERIGVSGFNYWNDFIYSNDYNFTTVAALDADAGAGALTNVAWQRKVAHAQNPGDTSNPDNTIFDLNHFVTPLLAGTPDTATIANSYDSLIGHVNRCATTLTITGSPVYPNFLEVVYYDLNFTDQLRVAEQLNG